ncbi:MAG: hypothetical protein ABJN69_08325 [Hellea sp.]
MKQQLILQFQSNSIEDYDAVIEYEYKLIELLEPDDEVDGHDVDGKKMNIFILSHNPTAAFENIRSSKLFESNNLLSKVIHRLIGSDNHHVLWPSNLEDFEI